MATSQAIPPTVASAVEELRRQLAEEGFKIDLDGESGKQVARVSRSDPNEGREGAPVVAVTFGADQPSGEIVVSARILNDATSSRKEEAERCSAEDLTEERARQYIQDAIEETYNLKL